jgi:23S rRNA (guanosine2251-2'-O)-methyltransferase
MSNPKRTNGHTDKKGPSSRGPSYWLYGLHAARAALGNGRREIHRALAAPGVWEKMGDVTEMRKLSPQVVSLQDIGALLPAGAVHQGIALEVLPLAEQGLEGWLSRREARPVLLLDQVTDPHNVGAILRSAAAFGAGAVIVTRDHAPPESATLAKASSGGIEIVPYLTVTNLTQCMETLKKHGYWCLGLDGEAKQTLAEANPSPKTALVLGAEGKGLRRLTAERCDLLVRLPIDGVMESLNVSNAAAVALYALRQHRAG